MLDAGVARPYRRLAFRCRHYSGSTAFRQAVEERWVPAITSFEPQLLFVSAGFDAHVDDPLGGLALTNADFCWISDRSVALAGEFCSGRVVSSLEGGYELGALGASVAAHVRALARL